MKASTLAAAAATIAAAAAPLSAAAAGYNVAWTIAGTECKVTPGESVKLGEFVKAAQPTKDAVCTPLTAGGLSSVSVLKASVPDFVTGAESVLKGKDPYVIVGVYNESAKCEGDFNVAIAVKADGTCIPGSNGKASYNVTWAPETGVKWLQYTDGKCSSAVTEVNFKPEETVGKTCTLNTLRAWAFPPKDFVAPGGNSSANSTKPENSTKPAGAADAAAAGYDVAWTIAGTECKVAPGESVKLGEFVKTAKVSKEAVCTPLTEGGLKDLSVLKASVPDFVTGAESVLKGKDPYVIVGVYNESAKCEGDFNVAIAVKADGTCIPGSNGKASYNVTWAPETGVKWLQYTDGKCSSAVTEVKFAPEETVGKTCTLNTLRAWAFPPEGFNANTTAPEPSVSAPAAGVPSPAVPSPAPTTSSAVTAVVSAATAVVAVAVASLA